MKNTKIQWTDDTWNCLRGCTRVSKGCEHCYAESVAHRFSGPGMPYEGLTVVNQSTGEPRWNGKIKLVEEHLLDPLRWQKPRMVFVNSMSDVFHEGVPDEYIDKMFAVMALCPQHVFQLLTKRPERMKEYLTKRNWSHRVTIAACGMSSTAPMIYLPLPNVWLGVSVEDQQTADDRIPLLLQTPAAVRWISAEPLLGPVKLNLARCLNCQEWVTPGLVNNDKDLGCPHCHAIVNMMGAGPWPGSLFQKRPIDWIVVGGESGTKARPFNVAWAHSIVQQCREANVACFVKQLGANAFGPSEGCKCGNDPHRLTFSDRKGGNIEEWPEDLRVREYPSTQTVAA